MRALLELGEETIELEASVRAGVDQRRPAPDAFGVELLVPARVERVGEVHPLAVAAELDHLRAAVQQAALRMGRLADDAAEVRAARLRGLEGVADVEPQELSGSPGRYVEPPVVERKVDVGDQRRDRPEALEERGQLVGVRRLSGDLD